MAISIFDSLPLDWNTIGCLSLNFVIGFLAFHASLLLIIIKPRDCPLICILYDGSIAIIFSRIFPIFHRMSGMAISIFDSLPLDWNTIGCLSLNFVIGFLAFHASLLLIIIKPRVCLLSNILYDDTACNSKFQVGIRGECFVKSQVVQYG